jgi:integrase
VVVEAFAAHLQAFPAGPDGLVFGGTLGQPHSRSSFWKPWRAVTERADARGFRFHGLRHHYASLLIRHGESVKTVPGTARARDCCRDARHLQPSVARVRRPDA